MLTYTYISKGKFGLVEKPKPTLLHERDAIVKVTLASICSSDLHIKHGSAPRAVEGITVVRMWCMRWQEQRTPSSLHGGALARMRLSRWWRFTTRRRLCSCSDMAGFITGENVCIDGGMTKQMIYHGDYGWKRRCVKILEQKPGFTPCPC